MSDLDHERNGFPGTDEWTAFRREAVDLRKELERTLRRLLVHDPRAVRAHLHSVSARDLADEALTWALSEWRSKPSATTPEQWMRKRALQLLDETLDRESLEAESRAEERLEESRLRRIELLDDDEERTRWMELLSGSRGAGTESFDGLEADQSVSNVQSRLDETELLEHLNRALAALPEMRRRVVVHRYLDDLPVEDVAYLLDVPVADVERELAQGVNDLRKELTPN